MIEVAMTPAPERRWSYSLRTLLLLVAVTSIVLAYSIRAPILEIWTTGSVWHPAVVTTRPPNLEDQLTRLGLCAGIVAMIALLFRLRRKRVQTPVGYNPRT
jgi:hypothetical protein